MPALQPAETTLLTVIEQLLLPIVADATMGAAVPFRCAKIKGR